MARRSEGPLLGIFRAAFYIPAESQTLSGGILSSFGLPGADASYKWSRRAGDGRDRGDPRGRAQGGGRAGRVGGRRIRRSCVVVRS